MIKRAKSLLIGLIVGITCVSLCGCAGGTFEPKYKTETESAGYIDGIIPLEIINNVTYVQKEKKGQWEKVSEELVEWKWDEKFNIQDKVVIAETEDVTSLLSDTDSSYKNVPAELYIHFGSNLKDLSSEMIEVNGEPALDLKLTITADMVLIINGKKYFLDDVPVKEAITHRDGSSVVKVVSEDEECYIFLPATSRVGVWADFQEALPTDEDVPNSMISETYIAKTVFDDLDTFDISSTTLTDGFWDKKITNTKYGDNISPELTWEAVDGADSYVVIMIDGAWIHMDVFTKETSLAEGAIERGDRGQQYVGPYPPSGTHTYSVFVFALKGEMGAVPIFFDAGGNSINLIYQKLDIDKDGNSGNVIAYARLDGNYTHED